MSIRTLDLAHAWPRLPALPRLLMSRVGERPPGAPGMRDASAAGNPRVGSAGGSPPGASPAIEVRNATHVYSSRQGGKVQALSDVSFSVQPGEFVSLVGPSGCGKSTLLRLVAGLMRVSEGEIRVAGTLVDQPSEDVGMVFQSPVLFPWRTVLDNCLFPVQIQRRPVREYRERALAFLQLVGLAEFANRYPWELSGGMQQRNAIARALLTEPRHLLMDEPFGALDALTRDTMTLELQRIWLSTRPSVLFVTHSISEAVFLSDRIVVFSPRPARVLEIIEVSFPRPRPVELTADADFGALALHIRQLLSV